MSCRQKPFRAKVPKQCSLKTLKLLKGLLFHLHISDLLNKAGQVELKQITNESLYAKPS